MAKCNRDCFNCIYDDCIIETASSKERKEIKMRDESYFNTLGSGILKQKPVRARHRHSRKVYA